MAAHDHTEWHDDLLLAKAAGRNHAIDWDGSVTTGTRLRRLELDDASG